MSQQLEKKSNVLVYTWKIENVDIFTLTKTEELTSPVFLIETLEEEFNLRLYIFAEKLWCYISDGFFSSDFKISVIAKDGSVTSGRNGFGLALYLNDENHKRNYLPKNYLIFQCEIWDKEDKTCLPNPFLMSTATELLKQEHLVTETGLDPELFSGAWADLNQVRRKLYRYPNEICARTRLHKEIRCLTWNISHFSSYRHNQKESILVLPSNKSELGFLFTICWTEDSNKEEKVEMCISILNQKELKNVFVGCKMSRMDCDGKLDTLKDASRTFTKEQNFLQSATAKQATPQLWNVANFGKTILLTDKDRYLQNDTLSLHFELVISTGVESSQIEKCNYLNQQKCYTNASGAQPRGNNLTDDLLCLCNEEKLCDVTLRVDGETLNAHKVVLCARSPVFSAMFERDMSEKASGVVDIEDVDMKTLRSMVVFMYSETLVDLDMESSMKLYIAADKYQFHVLKDKCASYLKSNLSVANVCEVLLLAELYQDASLSTATTDYICTHASEVFMSVHWKEIMKDKMQLAGEVMHKYITNMHS